MQKICSIHKLIFTIKQILRFHELKVIPIFDHAHQKIIGANFSFPEFAPALKNLLAPSVHSGDTVNFGVLQSDWPHPFLTIPTQKFFNQLLIYVNLYQHAKNKVISIICSGDMVD